MAVRESTTPAEIRELIRKLRADASVWGTEQAPLYAEAATALEHLLTRCEGLEHLLREARLHVRTVDGVIEAKIDAALSGGE